jgi:hypothetical protein
MFNDADVLVYASIPDDPEKVPHSIIACVLEKPDAVAEAKKVVLEEGFQPVGTVVSH